MGIATRIILYILPLLLLVVVGLVFFGQGGAWEDLKDAVFGASKLLPELGEAGTSLTFELKGDKTSLTVQGGSGGKQMITDLYSEFENMKPCVIAGPGRITENFRDYFLLAEEPLLHPYYRPVSSLTLFYSTSGSSARRK